MEVQTPLVLVLNAAAEIGRKCTVDAYLVAYWIYKHKMSFTTGDKTHEAIKPMRAVLRIVIITINNNKPIINSNK